MAIALDYNNRLLRPKLQKWQIFLITISGVIGIGFFKNSSEILGFAGPAGTIVAFVVDGVIVIMVMECICELINLWPISNPLVEFLRAFVDEDLAIAIGFAYWYTYLVTFPALLINTGKLADYWGLDTIYKAIIYALSPLILLGINFAPVEVFGWIEVFGGILKFGLVIVSIGFVAAVLSGAGSGKSIGLRYISQGFRNNPNVTANPGLALCAALPQAIFSYIGVELLAMTAFEARNPKELRQPARNIGWLMTVLYTISTCVFVSAVSWQDQSLPELYDQSLVAFDAAVQMYVLPVLSTKAIPVIACIRAGLPVLPTVLTGCFIYSGFSAANTALYAASRALYGLTRNVEVDANSGWFLSIVSWTSRLEPRSHVPWNAVVVSVVLLYWLPFIGLNDSELLEEIQTALSRIGTVSCVIVWWSQCLAYICFYRWRNLHSSGPNNELARSRHARILDTSHAGWFVVLQPVTAAIGALGTFAIVVFFNTVSFWNGQRLAFKISSALVSPIVIFLIYLISKLRRHKSNRRWRFVDLSEWPEFQRRLARLDDMRYPMDNDSASQKSGSPGQAMNTEMAQLLNGNGSGVQVDLVQVVGAPAHGYGNLIRKTGIEVREDQR